jgi:hypothetical protein
MRNIIIIFATTILFGSCIKSNKPSKTYRHRGFVYSSVDSLPFENTQFKVFNNGLVTKVGDEKTKLFSTNEFGYFDVTVDFTGAVFWPSYFVGSAYTGPDRLIETGGKDSINENVNQSIIEYNAYTKPYH